MAAHRFASAQDFIVFWNTFFQWSLIMKNISECVADIQGRADCKLLPVRSQELNIDLSNAPEYVREFFRLCGGAVLNIGEGAEIVIVSPRDFSEINRSLYPEGDVIWEELEGDVSQEWFLIASDVGKGQYVSIDMNDDRLGWCYDSFLETHATPGDSTVIAKSFTEFLQNTMSSPQRFYWLCDTYVSYGDAYDNLL